MNFEKLVENLLEENTTHSAYKKQGGSGLVSGLVTDTGKFSAPNTGTTAQVFTPKKSSNNTIDYGRDEDITSTKNRGSKGAKGSGLKGCFSNKVSFLKTAKGKGRKGQGDFKNANSPVHRAGADLF
jgi:hypothetical protein